jgi:hypothetical protein
MIRSLFACSLFFAIAACGGSSSHPATTPPTTAATDGRCPMSIDGTSVSVLDTPTGGTLAFRTTGDAAALRSRVAGWAERHTARHAAMGPLPTGAETAPAGGEHAHHHHHDHGGAPAEGEAAAPASASADGDPATMIDAHSSATATDVDGGVDLTFVTFPDQLAGLQAELRTHAEHLAASGCGAP